MVYRLMVKEKFFIDGIECRIKKGMQIQVDGCVRGERKGLTVVMNIYIYIIANITR
jgi:hypothetical protein